MSRNRMSIPRLAGCYYATQHSSRKHRRGPGTPRHKALSAHLVSCVLSEARVNLHHPTTRNGHRRLVKPPAQPQLQWPCGADSQCLCCTQNYPEEEDCLDQEGFQQVRRKAEEVFCQCEEEALPGEGSEEAAGREDTMPVHSRSRLRRTRKLPKRSSMITRKPRSNL